MPASPRQRSPSSTRPGSTWGSRSASSWCSRSWGRSCSSAPTGTGSGSDAGSAGADQGEDPARPGDALQLVLAAIVELEARALEQVAGRGRHQDFAGSGERGDPGGGVDRQAARAAGDDAHLAGVCTGPDPEAEVLDGRAHRGGAADGAGRRIEDREEAVPGGRDLAAAMDVQLPAEARVVFDDERPPGRVADSPEKRGRIDEVGQEV